MKSRKHDRSTRRSIKKNVKKSYEKVYSTKTRVSIAKGRSRGRPRKLKMLTILPSQGKKKVYCGDLAYLPSDEYDRFGTRRECLDKGYGIGRASEYSYLREKLQEIGYLLPERTYGRSVKKDDYEII
jgi:hypothetical protein